MQKIIFFDIDRTFYNYKQFLSNFYLRVQKEFNLEDKDLEKLTFIYEKIKTELGYFAPDKYLGPILQNFPQMDYKTLYSIFWDKKLIQDCLYEDSKALFELAKIAKIGIFSKGDERFQTQKITAFKNIIDEKDVFVFKDKISKVGEMFEMYNEFKIYLVDDHTTVLLRAKEENERVTTILIDRDKSMGKSDRIDAIINNLWEVKDIVDE